MFAKDKIFRQLGHLRDAGQAVQLMSSYKGLPIVRPAAPVSLGFDEAVFQVHRHQAVCLRLAHETVLDVPELPMLVQAAVAEVDLATSRALLNDFRYTRQPQSQRGILRLQPGEALEVVLAQGTQAIHGWLADISYGGLGVKGVAAHALDPAFVIRGMAVQLAFYLSHQYRMLELSGVIANSLLGGDYYRIGLRFQPQPDAASRHIIAAYMARRQPEIIQEIRLLSGSKDEVT